MTKEISNRKLRTPVSVWTQTSQLQFKSTLMCVDVGRSVWTGIDLYKSSTVLTGGLTPFSYNFHKFTKNSSLYTKRVLNFNQNTISAESKGVSCLNLKLTTWDSGLKFCGTKCLGSSSLVS